MHASSLFVLAAAGAASVLATETTTSTSTMTAYITLTKCDATHPDCPLHTPTTSSSVAVSTSSSAIPSSAPAYSVEAHHNTTVVYPTAQYNATKPKYTMSGTAPITIQTSIPHDTPTQGSSYPTTTPSPSPIPETSAAGAFSLASGLLVGALGAVAAMLV